MRIFVIIIIAMMMNACDGQTKQAVVRPATQANRFYTGDAEELREEVDSFLRLHRGRTLYENVAAVIVPHAGYYYSGNVAASAYMSIDA
jgi:AmmeMemoRadiSam system protein B